MIENIISEGGEQAHHASCFDDSSTKEHENREKLGLKKRFMRTEILRLKLKTGTIDKRASDTQSQSFFNLFRIQTFNAA
jgi:hypothetical protein